MAVADAEESNGQATARQSQIRPIASRGLQVGLSVFMAWNWRLHERTPCGWALCGSHHGCRLGHVYLRRVEKKPPNNYCIVGVPPQWETTGVLSFGNGLGVWRGRNEEHSFLPCRQEPVTVHGARERGLVGGGDRRSFSSDRHEAQHNTTQQHSTAQHGIGPPSSPLPSLLPPLAAVVVVVVFVFVVVVLLLEKARYLARHPSHTKYYVPLSRISLSFPPPSLLLPRKAVSRKRFSLHLSPHLSSLADWFALFLPQRRQAHFLYLLTPKETKQVQVQHHHDATRTSTTGTSQAQHTQYVPDGDHCFPSAALWIPKKGQGIPLTPTAHKLSSTVPAPGSAVRLPEFRKHISRKEGRKKKKEEGPSTVLISFPFRLRPSISSTHTKQPTEASLPDSPAPYILITTISPRNNTSTADIVRIPDLLDPAQPGIYICHASAAYGSNTASSPRHLENPPYRALIPLDPVRYSFGFRYAILYFVHPHHLSSAHPAPSDAQILGPGATDRLRVKPVKPIKAHHSSLVLISFKDSFAEPQRRRVLWADH
ncbi:hypothetical protein K456DRAFT_43400 [Colletotrichum gloeosporioides 23]|nr:hypothetical protein K456DRAFT_43400 [Colletotrichum gloeosporioides 23]